MTTPSTPLSTSSSSTTPVEPVHRPIKPLPPFSSFPLIRKETLVPPSQDPSRPYPPVYRFTFAYLSHESLPLDPRTQYVKVIRPGPYKPKSYTPTSSDVKGQFELVVKIYPHGGTSQWLDSVPIGQRVSFIGPLPLPIKRRIYSPGNHIIIIALGVGITHGFATARDELQQGKATVHLIHAVRYREEVVLKPEMDALLGRYEDRFRVTRIASRDTVDGWKRGRVDQNVVRESVVDLEDDRIRFLVVGTKTMIKQTWSMLAEMGYSHKQHALVRKPFK